TGGQLVLTDLDATAATVVEQRDVAGSYGTFSVDAAGKWSYVTNDALNQLNAGQRVTETFEVATSDGGKASVTVIITGSEDVAQL
ncbi:VCBS domain-containing protein, partial [Aeromonas media]